MKGIYYKLPIDFEGLMKKQDLAKIALEDSISQSIFTLMTTSFGECKFDETYGCELWDSDFDLLKSDNELKVFVAKSLKNSILQHEKRIFLQDVEVTISEQDLGNTHKKRMKKKILVSVRAIILETNRPFVYDFFFFVSPLSY
jgi:GPW/gp25 family protein